MFASSPPRSYAPRRPLPPGACDAHAHIFGPEDAYPVTGPSSYDPPLAPYETYQAMQRTIGVEHGVLVQPAAYRFDHRAMLDAFARSGRRIAGVGLADSSVSEAELLTLREQGVVGLRFVEVASSSGTGRYIGSVGFEQLYLMAPRMKALGLQAHLWCDPAMLLDEAPKLLALQIPLVIDHMGRINTGPGIGDPHFQKFLAYVRDGKWWVKLALCRTSSQFPDYPDTRPFHDALVAANPDRLIWGSDWPHIRLGEKTPDVGHLLDILDEWIGHDDDLRKKILVDNAQALFGFAKSAEG